MPDAPPDPPKDPQAIIFIATDPLGQEVALNEGGWYHSRWERGHGVSQGDIREALEDPDLMVEDRPNQSVNYVKYIARRRFFRLVGVKEQPGREPRRHQVATAFSRSTPPQGTVLWRKSTKP